MCIRDSRLTARFGTSCAQARHRQRWQQPESLGPRALWRSHLDRLAWARVCLAYPFFKCQGRKSAQLEPEVPDVSRLSHPGRGSHRAPGAAVDRPRRRRSHRPSGAALAEAREVGSRPCPICDAVAVPVAEAYPSPSGIKGYAAVSKCQLARRFRGHSEGNMRRQQLGRSAFLGEARKMAGNRG